MPSIPLTEVITRAALAADMHDNFATDAWVYWANVEDKALRVRLAQCAFPMEHAEVQIALSSSLTADGITNYQVPEPLAITAVKWLNSDNSFKRLTHVPFPDRQWRLAPTGMEPDEFSVYTHQNLPNIIAIEFNPRPESGTVVVETVPLPKKLSLTPAAGESSVLNYPLGFEERIVLGMAQRALAKEETVNAALERQIEKIDEHINNACFRRLMADAAVRKVDVATPSWILF